MDLQSLFAGQRKMFELLVTLEEHGTLYVEELGRLGWNKKTALTTLRRLEKNSLVYHEVEFGGNKGSRKWYKLTEKGKEVLSRLNEIDQLLRT